MLVVREEGVYLGLFIPKAADGEKLDKDGEVEQQNHKGKEHQPTNVDRMRRWVISDNPSKHEKKKAEIANVFIYSLLSYFLGIISRRVLAILSISGRLLGSFSQAAATTSQTPLGHPAGISIR